MKTYKAYDIASFFIKKGVSPLKLQKLLYYAQVWFFVKKNDSLFEDDIQAWVFGPVVYDVWSNLRFIKRGDIIPLRKATDAINDTDTLQHLNDVWNAYGSLSGAQLVDATHQELPWKNSRKGLLTNQPSNQVVLINKSTTQDFILDKRDLIPLAKIDDTATGKYSNF